MIIIKRKDNPNIGARILNADSYSVKELHEIVAFWDRLDDYEIEVAV